MARARKKVLVLSRITTLERLSGQDGRPRIGSLASRQSAWFARIEEAHGDHQDMLSTIRSALSRLGCASRVVQSMEGLDPNRYDLVLTAGGDGTVLYASHHVETTPILGVRSSRHSAGYLTGAARRDVEKKLSAFTRGRLESTLLQRMSVLVGDRLMHDKILNEALFSHPNPAVTTRYVLIVDGRSEEQMSSGLWVGPAAGSTAAIRSAGGRILSATSRNIQFVVREPITRPGMRVGLTRGLIPAGRELIVANKWQPARLYLDGPHLVIPVRPGQEVKMRLSDRPLTLLGWSKRTSRRSP
ncbi:MAG: NAD(+)/NADH kinase [Deltaproteobacteria bacterium]|nr:NAD(+)/NADH kinase [Deltaproteobacteria bacterium]